MSSVKEQKGQQDRTPSVQRQGNLSIKILLIAHGMCLQKIHKFIMLLQKEKAKPNTTRVSEEETEREER